MANQFVARKGLVSKADSNITGSLVISGSNNGLRIKQGKLSLDQPVDISFANGQIIDDNGSGGLRIYTPTYSTDIYSGKSGTLKFFTSGSVERVRLDAAGNMGIGTNSPSTTLHVAGNTAIHTAGTYAGANGDPFTIQDPLPAIRLIDSQATSRVARISAENGALHFESDLNSAESNNDIRFSLDGTERLRILNSGNVGIGTTSPGYKLDVSGSGRFSSRLTLNSPDYNQHLNLRRGSYGVDFILTGARLDISPTASTTEIKFLSNTKVTGSFTAEGATNLGSAGNDVNIGNASSGYMAFKRTGHNYIAADQSNGTLIFRTGGTNNRMIINSSGNVGIGTLTPLAPLDVNGNIYSSGNLLVDTIFSRGGSSDLNLDGRAGYGVNVRSGSTSIAYFDYDTARVGIGLTNPSAPLHISQSSTSGVKFSRINHDDIDLSLEGSNRFVISNTTDGLDLMALMYDTGRVGIGTNSPAAKLTVSQSADNDGIRVYGHDDKHYAYGNMFIDSAGNFRIQNSNSGSSGYIQIGADDYLELTAPGLVYTTSNFRIYDAGQLSIGSGGDYKFKYDNVNDRLDIHTDDNKGLTIDNVGKLGIGTTSPDYQLQVESSGNAEIQTQRTSGAGVLIQSQASVGVVGTNTNHRLDLKTNGGTRATISTAGNVGIGLTSPVYKLHVSAGTTNEVARFESTDGTSMISFKDSNKTGYVGLTNTRMSFGYAGNLGASNLNIISGSGNVGIGTTNPATKLTVAGAISASSGFYGDGSNLTGVTTSDTLASILNNGNEAQGAAIVMGSGDIQDAGEVSAITLTGTTGSFSYVTASADLFIDTDVEIGGDELKITRGHTSRIPIRLHTSNHKGAITLERDGVTNVNISSDEPNLGHTYFNGNGTNVGIGTTSPTHKLHVAGTARIQSDTQVTGSLVVADSSGNEMFIDSNEIFSKDLDLYLKAKQKIVFQPNNGTTAGGWNSNGRLGVGNISPAAELHVEGEGATASGNKYQFIVADNTAYGINKGGGLIFRGDYNSATSQSNFAAIRSGKANANDGNANAYLAFLYGASGTLTEGMRIDYNGKVGIGTTSPSQKLEVIGTIKQKTGAAYTNYVQQSVSEAQLEFSTYSNNQSTFPSAIKFSPNGTEAVRIDNSGAVGIGVTNPGDFNSAADNLVVGTGAGSNGITVYSGTSSAGGLYFADASGSGAGNRDGVINYNHGSATMEFKTGGNQKVLSIATGTSTFHMGNVVMENDLTVKGIVTAEEFHTEFVSSSIIYSSGSTKFGDTSDDDHEFTGSISLSGNNTALTIKNLADSGADTGVEIRGARNGTVNGVTSYLNFTNYDNNSGGLHSLGRIYGSMASTGNNDGTLTIQTYNGSDYVNGIKIHESGNTGIGGTLGVGILEASASSTLDVVSATTPEVYIRTSALSSQDAILRIKGSRTTSTTSEIAQIRFETNDEDASGIDLARISALKDTASTNVGRLEFKTMPTDGGTLATRMTIKGDGNVGIGTTDPETKLHVASGNVLLSNNQYYSAENTAGTNYKLAGISSGNVVQIGAIDYTTAGTVLAGGDNVSITTGGAGGSTRMYISGSGNVGIGTTAPSQKLEVRDGNLIVSSSNSEIALGPASGKSRIFTNSTKDIRFSTANTGDVLFLKNSNGLVGIGTTSPTKRLTVEGAVSASSGFYGDGSNLTGITTSDGLAEILENNNSAGGFDLDMNTNNILSVGEIQADVFNGTSASLAYVTGSAGIRVQTRLGIQKAAHSTYAVDVNGSVNASSEFRAPYGKFDRINNRPNGNAAIGFASDDDITFYSASSAIAVFSGGNLGIGTSNPKEKLDVAGSIYAGIAGNNSAITPALIVSASGTGTGQASAVIKQARSEGDTLIFSDYGPYVEYNFMHENSANEFRIYGGTSSNSLGSDTFYNTAGTARTGYKKWVVSQTSGNMYVAGKVGVGTTTPDEKLDVVGKQTFSGTGISHYGNPAAFGTGSNGDKVIFYNDGTSYDGRIGVGSTSNLWLKSYGETADEGDIEFYAGGSKRVTIKGDGKVGIGTAAPDYTLDVAGNMGVDEIIYHNGDSNTYLQFQSDRVRLVAGGHVAFDYDESGASTLDIDPGGQADISISNGIIFVGGSEGSYNDKVGINTSDPIHTLDVTGEVGATSFIETSARKFKENIEPIEGALDIVSNIDGVTFNRIGEERREYGFIADEIESTVPELVSYDANGEVHGVHYARTVAVLTEAVKELNDKVKAQDLFIKDLVARIEKLENK